MAKTRAQRKAERRVREAQQPGSAAPSGVKKRESVAQHDTQTGKSGDVAEVEAIEAGIAAGAPEAELELPDTPKPSRAERRAEEKALRDSEKARSAEQKRNEREKLARRQKQAAEERKRGRVIGFIASCWAELKKVQWPDRETLVQATVVTVIFVGIAAAYLGVLDAAFSFLIKKVL